MPLTPFQRVPDDQLLGLMGSAWNRRGEFIEALRADVDALLAAARRPTRPPAERFRIRLIASRVETVETEGDPIRLVSYAWRRELLDQYARPVENLDQPSSAVDGDLFARPAINLGELHRIHESHHGLDLFAAIEFNPVVEMWVTDLTRFGPIRVFSHPLPDEFDALIDGHALPAEMWPQQYEWTEAIVMSDGYRRISLPEDGFEGRTDANFTVALNDLETVAGFGQTVGPNGQVLAFDQPGGPQGSLQVRPIAIDTPVRIRIVREESGIPVPRFRAVNPTLPSCGDGAP